MKDKRERERSDIMRINPVHLGKLQKVYGDQKENNNVQQHNTAEDEINISSKAQEIQELEQNLQDTTDIREEKVNNLKNAIEEGTYDIDPEQIAEKILEDSQE